MSYQLSRLVWGGTIEPVSGSFIGSGGVFHRRVTAFTTLEWFEGLGKSSSKPSISRLGDIGKCVRLPLCVHILEAFAFYLVTFAGMVL